MKTYLIRSIGQNKGKPRLYLDLPVLTEAGFNPGVGYERQVADGRITLRVHELGSYHVSQKEKGGRTIPVIDISSAEALKMFAGMPAVRIVLDHAAIHILPLASVVRKVEREQRLSQNLAHGKVTTAGAAFGGGVLDHAAHAGLSKAGVASELVFANEIDTDLLMHASEHNDLVIGATVKAAAPMQELVQDDWAMGKIPKADVLCMGIPCSGASVAGKSKRDLSLMENHPEVGHLVASAIQLVQRINPSVIVIENVTQYADTASAQIMRQHFRDCGYDVRETVLKAEDFGCLEHRERWFMVAASRGIDVDLEAIAPKLKPVKTVAEVLDAVPEDSSEWRSFDYLKTKEVRDEAKGNGFAMQVVTPDCSKVPVLRKGYHKGGSTDPLLAHPSNPDLLRQFTVAEHARIKGVPEILVNGLSKTDGHILLGQSVAYEPVVALFKRIGQALLAWASQQHTTESSVGYRLNLATG